MQVEMFFQQKSVLITGAGSGIGQALALAFARCGANLGICDIDGVALEKTTQEVRSKYPDITVHMQVMDVANRSEWELFLQRANDALGSIDVVINNAGIEGSSKPVWATSERTLRRVMEVNFFGMVNGSQLALPYLVNRPWAALVNVSSVFGFVGPPNAADYAASKFAIRGFTEAMHSELAQLYPNVQVHLVHPGGIATNITRTPQSQAFHDKFLKTKPIDLANAILEGVMRNQVRVVFGHRSGLVQRLSRWLPLKWLSKAIGSEMKSLNMTTEYQKDHPGFTLRNKP